MGSYDLYHELELAHSSDSDELAELLDARIRLLLDEGLSPMSPEVDQLVTARAVLADPVKREIYDAVLNMNDGQVTVTWLHLLADSRRTPRRVRGTPAEPPLNELRSDGRSRRFRNRARQLVVPVLFFFGGVGAVVAALMIDPVGVDSAGFYLRVLVALTGYVLCIRALAELIGAIRSGDGN